MWIGRPWFSIHDARLLRVKEWRQHFRSRQWFCYHIFHFSVSSYLVKFHSTFCPDYMHFSCRASYVESETVQLHSDLRACDGIRWCQIPCYLYLSIQSDTLVCCGCTICYQSTQCRSVFLSSLVSSLNSPIAHLLFCSVSLFTMWFTIRQSRSAVINCSRQLVLFPNPFLFTVDVVFGRLRHSFGPRDYACTVAFVRRRSRIIPIAAHLNWKNKRKLIYWRCFSETNIQGIP